MLGRKPIGTVCYLGGVPAILERFVWSWGQMIQYNAEIFCKDTEFVHYDRVTFSDHAPARNALAGRFMGDWLCYLDTDHCFEPDIVARLYRLLDYHDLDVVTGLYRFKKSPCSPVAFNMNPDSDNALQPLATWPDDLDLIQIDAAGAGCLMIRRHVLDRIRMELKQEPFDRKDNLSEDHSFFKRLRELEIKAYLAPKIEAQHLRVEAVDKAEDASALSLSNPIPVEGYRND